VCTGNICRSPAVEARLRARLGPRGGIQVASAGLQALVGEPIDPDMAVALGTGPPGFRARQVSAGMLRASDLILTMTRAQRSAVVIRAPDVVRRAFTLREFADLAEMVPADVLTTGPVTAGERLAELVARAPRMRAHRTAGSPDDIADPYRRGPEAHAVALALLDDAVTRLVTLLDAPEAGEPDDHGP
jgi:protein-tyrosine phosphatase